MFLFIEILSRSRHPTNFPERTIENQASPVKEKKKDPASATP